jgi:hypothetical protein
MHRLNDPLCATVISDGLACRFDTRTQRRLANELIGPELIEQFLPGDNTITMGNQIGEQIHNASTQRHQRLSVA